MEEIWREVPGHEHQVSNCGRVWCSYYNEYLVPDRLNQVFLVTDPNSAVPCNVGKLVALLFTPGLDSTIAGPVPPDDRPYVKHIDGNIYNNCISNLRWVRKRVKMVKKVKPRPRSLNNKSG